MPSFMTMMFMKLGARLNDWMTEWMCRNKLNWLDGNKVQVGCDTELLR